MQIELDIEKLQDNEASKNENIFLECPCTLIIGQTRSGKTVLLQNLLFKHIFATYKPENVYVFSRTVFKDEKWKPFLKKLHQTDSSLLEKNAHMNTDKLYPLITDLQNKSLLGKIEDKTLIIFDDMIGSKEITAFNSPLSNFIPMCRHDKISFIILTQKYKRISNTIRENTDQLYVGFCSSGITPLIEEISQTYPKKALIKMYEKIHKQRNYDFLVIRKDRSVEDGYFRKNFDEILNPYDYI